MTALQAIKQATATLSDAGISSPALSAKLLLQAAANWDYQQLVLLGHLELTPKILKIYEKFIDKRLAHKPIAYISNTAQFCGLNLFVNQNVLIPRTESEQLVELTNTILSTVFRKQNKSSAKVKSKIVNFVDKRSTNNIPIEILELGTGSGAISLAIANNFVKINQPTNSNINDKQLPFLHITATDISDKALIVARKNAKHLDLLESSVHKITFIKSDLLKSINFDRLKPLIIITNLPYVPSQRIETLDQEVKNFEPHLALDGGDDGFELYRQLYLELNNYQHKPLFVICEIDDTHHKIALDFIQTLPTATRPLSSIILNDLAGKTRFLITSQLAPNQIESTLLQALQV